MEVWIIETQGQAVKRANSKGEALDAAPAVYQRFTGVNLNPDQRTAQREALNTQGTWNDGKGMALTIKQL